MIVARIVAKNEQDSCQTGSNERTEAVAGLVAMSEHDIGLGATNEKGSWLAVW
jgi:hypothetical protein